MSCIVCAIGKENADKADEKVKSLKKSVYDPDAFSYTDECAICKVKFVDKDQITPLPCDPKHYFHNHCIARHIETSIKDRHAVATCPMCKKSIDPAHYEN